MSTLTNRGPLTNGPESNGTQKQRQSNGPTHGILKSKQHREQSVDTRPAQTTTTINDKDKRIERQADPRPSDPSAGQLSGSNRIPDDPDTSPHSLERRRTYNISAEDEGHSNRSPKSKDSSQSSSEDLRPSVNSAGVRTSRRSSENPTTSHRPPGRTHPSRHAPGGDVPSKHYSEERPRASNASSGGRGSSDDPAGRRDHGQEDDLAEVRPKGRSSLRRSSADEKPLTAQEPILIPYLNVPYNMRLQQALTRARGRMGAEASPLKSMRGSRSVDLLNGPTGAPAASEGGDEVPSRPEVDPGRRSSVKGRDQVPSKPEVDSGARSSGKGGDQVQRKADFDPEHRSSVKGRDQVPSKPEVDSVPKSSGKGGDHVASNPEFDSERRSSVKGRDQVPGKPEIESGPRSSVKLRKWANPGRERPTSEILPSKNLRFEKLDGVTRPKKYNTSTGDCMKPSVPTSLPRLGLPGVPNFTTVSRRHTGDSPIADRGLQLSERVRRGDAAREFGSIPWGPVERGAAETLRRPGASPPSSPPQSPRGNAARRASSSHVRVRVNGELWHYIATQWPQSHTESDFWHMVWEHDVNVIAALTPAQVSGDTKPQRYWPRLGSRQRPSVFGDLAVHATFRGTTAAGGCATTGLRLAHAPSGKERNLWHLHHPEWSCSDKHDDDDDDGVERFLEFLQELQSVRRLTGSMLAPRTPLPPTLVHCAGGDAPTGVLVLSELMVACLEQNVNADVPQVLVALRQQRPQLVPTLEHYEFVYRVLARYLGRSRLI